MVMVDYKEVADFATWPRQLDSINKQEIVDIQVLIGNNIFPNINLQISIP